MGGTVGGVVDNRIQPRLQIQLELPADDNLPQQGDSLPLHEVEEHQPALLLVFVVDAEGSPNDRRRFRPRISRTLYILAGDNLMQDAGGFAGDGAELR